MLNLLHLSLFGYITFVSCLVTDPLKLMNNSPNHFLTKSIQLQQELYLKSENDFVCTSQSLISDNSFSNSVRIKTDTGCQSITIIKCKFNSISIPDSSQPTEQISLIYIKNSDLSIENSDFQECTSKAKISLSIDNNPELESLFCHAIFIDENANYNVLIDNCIFLNNGKDAESGGTIIFSYDANNIEVLSSQFKSDQAYTRAFQTFNTKKIILTNNTFYKMTSPIGQNGGAVLIQFATNVSIRDTIFDSNTLQPKSTSSTDTNFEVCGSAFYINLNSSFTFTNNTISNHDNFLNSVITFNKNEADTKMLERSIIISESNFNNNKYTKSIDGSGIGFYAEDFNENFDNSNFLNIIFSGCNFTGNGDSTSNDAAGVFGWSKETSSFSFIDCTFESNKVSSSSSLIKILNGRLLNIESCIIEENVNYNFLNFSPITGDAGDLNLQDIRVRIFNTTIINTDLTNRVNSDLILIDKDSDYNTTLIITGCTFTDIFLNENNFVIHSQSNLNLVQISDTKITCNDQTKRSNLIKFQTSNINQIEVNDCEFKNSLFAFSSDVNINSITFDNSNFIDCISDSTNIATIKLNSNHFTFNNCDLIFSQNTNNACSMGIFISNTKSVSILNSNFKNCYGSQPGSAIRSLSQDDFETSFTVASCTFEECTPESNVYTTNRIVNFLNNSISCSNINKKINGIFANYICQLLIDNCTFTKCSYSSDGASIRYAPPTFDQKVKESIIVQNCKCIECSGRGSLISANPFDSHPKFINVSILKSYHTFNFIIETKSNQQQNPGEVLLQNVSFIDNHPNGNVALGGGGIGFWYMTKNTNEDTVSFIGCHFEDTFYQAADGNNYGGGAICIQSVSCQNYYVNILSCYFKNCYTMAHNGGSIAITTTKKARIEDCYLEKCRIESSGNAARYVGGAIYVSHIGELCSFYLTNVTVNESLANTDYSAIDFESANCDEFVIRDCNFINCKTKGDFSASYNIISCPSVAFLFECENSKFIFDEKSENNPRAFRVFISNFYVNKCTFTRCGSKKITDGGAFFYDGMSSNEMISVSNSYFEECDAAKSGAFELKMFSYKEPVLYNNTLIRINSVYSMDIEFKSPELRAGILIKEHNFIENVHNSRDGGGAGIGLSNHKNAEFIYGVNLALYHCNFINNFSPYDGGAYGTGSTDLTKSIELDIENCNFTGNHCDGSEGGGALWIRTSNDCFVLSCNFFDNHASTSQISHGGAVYLSFTSEITVLTLDLCTFVNNSCPFPDSHGHVVYSTLLYGSCSIGFSNFTDNGIDVEEKNSIIYTKSKLYLSDSYLCYTDKEKAFSRAIYIGSSSDLTISGSTIANFSYPDGSGGALYYSSIKNRLSGRIDISEDTFINNTASEIGSELYLHVHKLPMINNCSFLNENSEKGIIAIISDKLTELQLRYDRLYFENCDFHNNGIYLTVTSEGEMIPESITFYGCTFFKCCNVSLIFREVYQLGLADCVFDQIVNNDDFIIIDDFQISSITNCQLKNIELIETGIEKVDHAAIHAFNSRLTIQNTIIDNFNIHLNDEHETSNCFVIKTDINLVLKEVSIYNCPSCHYAVHFQPPSEPQYDEWLGTPIMPEFTVDSCTFSNSGSVFIQNLTDVVNIINSVFANSTDGLIYNLNMNSDGALFDDLQFQNNTFDGLTNRACFIIIHSEINFGNCTIKNCHLADEDCNPIFEIEVRNGLVFNFLLDSFIFENNSFNNNNNKNRWMNGGGTGFIISPKNRGNEESNENDFSLNFVHCTFISNNAESFGGAFAFFESTEKEVKKMTFLTFDDCYFEGNTCKKLKGSALYLITKNVSITNCVFDSNSKQQVNEDNSAVYLYFIPKDLNSIEDKISDSFSLTNCSFTNNQGRSIHIDNSTREMTITNCTFSSNQDYSLYLTNCNLINSIYDCTFSNNQDNSMCIENSNSSSFEFPIFDCIFSSNQKYSIHLINFASSVSVSSCSFSENKESSICVLESKEDVFVNDCTFESSKIDTNDENQLLLFDYEITCHCTKSFIIDNVSFINTGGIYILPESPISNQIKLTRIKIENGNYGFFFEPSNKVFSKISKVEILIENCTFLAVKHALMLSLINNKLTFYNNSILNCSNLENKEDKTSIIEIKANSLEEGQQPINLVFNKIHFFYNQFLQPKKSTIGFGGGIGMNVLQDNENKKKFGIEFKDCDFLLNKATDGETNHIEKHYSGGAFYYVNDDKLTLSSLTFENCNFVSNFAVGKGGAVYIETGNQCSLLILNCSFYINKADVDAAAVFVKNGFKFTLESSQFVNNSVSTKTSTDLLIPTDSLVVVSSSEATIESNLFIKSSYANLETNVQTSFMIDRRSNNKDQIKIQIEDCQFSSINPSKSIVSLRNLDKQSTIRIYNSSFTHFYLSTHIKDRTIAPTPPENRNQDDEDEDEEETNEVGLELLSNNLKMKNLLLLQIINDSSNYLPIFIFDDSVGKFEIEQSCFDTDSIYSFDKTKVGFDEDSSNSQIQGKISVVQNQVKSMDCYYPPVILDLMKEIFDSTPIPNPTPKPSHKSMYIIIGSVLGAFVIIMIVVIVVVVVLVKKKRKKELEEQLRLEAEKTNEMNEENEMINTKFIFATQATTQENPLFTYANVNNNNNNNMLDNFYEESK